MQEERMTFKVTSPDGKEVECETLFTFESEETNKNYIVYTDNTKDEQGNTKVYEDSFESYNYLPNKQDRTLKKI